MGREEMIWDELTSGELVRIDRNVPVVLPITATEQHGPHLPLATDRIIGEYFAHRLHESIPEQVLILPTVNIGCSTHHMDFSGTLTLSHDSFSNQIHDIVESVIKHGFGRIVLLNSHGGNMGIGRVLIEQLGDQYPDAHFVMATWWQMVTEELKKITETGRGGIGHAGEFETSLMMVIAPHLVIDEKIMRGRNTPIFPWAETDMLRSSKAFYYRSIKEKTSNGIYGDPTAASKEKGRQIAECVITTLKKIVINLFNLQTGYPAE